ncbi:MAG: thermonuclease family protein [Candidatus Odinarchaeia archaeon]
MDNFFKQNKVFLAIIVGALVVGAGVYFGLARRGEEPLSTECLAPSEATVTKVLDGDTLIVEGGYHIRLLGVDADERGYPCYEAAKSRLEELILNKEVRLEKDQTDVDQYDRCLRYIFLDDENINLQLVKEGLAIARFYPPDLKYREEITRAEEEAIDNKVGCKWGGATAEGKETKPQAEWKELTTANLGYDVVGACQAGKYLGRELIIEGKIADTYHDLKSNTVFFNFEKPYPNQCFTGVIFSSNLHKFVQNPEDYYLNKTVRIMGEVKEYQGRPEIILETPNQIEVGE